MSGLSKYEVAEFEQGAVLGSAYQNKRDVQGGICVALSVAWVHAIEGGSSVGDLDAVKQRFDMSVNTQRIFVDAHRDIAEGMFYEKFNSISHITRLKLGLLANGVNVDPLKLTFANMDDDFFFLIVALGSATHMIALRKEEDVLALFDANFGVFLAKGDDEVEDMSEALFDKYKTLGMPIKAWLVCTVDFAESALERFKRVSGAR